MRINNTKLVKSHQDQQLHRKPLSGKVCFTVCSMSIIVIVAIMKTAHRHTKCKQSGKSSLLINFNSTMHKSKW